MSVRVMLIRDVGVSMPRRLVPVQVAVLTHRQRVMCVGVVPVVMGVGVFMFRLVVLVFVPVAFDEVKNDARGHQHRTGQHPGTSAAFAEQEREECPDERSEGEHRPGARGAEEALREQVEAQAQAIAGGAHRQQGQCRPQAGHGFAKAASSNSFAAALHFGFA